MEAKTEIMRSLISYIQKFFQEKISQVSSESELREFEDNFNEYLEDLLQEIEELEKGFPLTSLN